MRKITERPPRQNFIGGSDARIIMGKDEKALLRLWKEKRGEGAPLPSRGQANPQTVNEILKRLLS